MLKKVFKLHQVFFLVIFIAIAFGIKNTVAKIILTQNDMETLFVLRNIFRGILLISLLSRWFIIDKINNYNLELISYILLVLGLAGVVVLEVIIYIQKKKL